jgi:hypothetical protein
MDSLTDLRRATARRQAVMDQEAERWHAAIRAALADGHSQRTVADAAGITHTRVQQILRGE